jgi:AcrR family transcriptional regulator
MAVTTKERILEAAEEMMLSKSFHSVGLREILKAVKVPRGSFYHHFSSKEQFGVELLQHYVNAHTQRLDRHFRTEGITGMEKFTGFAKRNVVRAVLSRSWVWKSRDTASRCER